MQFYIIKLNFLNIIKLSANTMTKIVNNNMILRYIYRHAFKPQADIENHTFLLELNELKMKKLELY